MQRKPVCLITGATGGIGRATAQLLDKHEISLILHGRDEKKLKNLQSLLVGYHPIVIGDLVSASERQNIIETAFSELTPNTLINNAGTSLFKPFMNTSAEELEQLLMLNLTATIDMTRLFLNRANQPSTIVNVGSAFGAIGYPGYSVYCASKFGLRGFTEALNREFASTGNRACYFAPRATNTEMNSSNVIKMNSSIGNHVDAPEVVANALLELVKKPKPRTAIGWPEAFFARLNGLLPELVDNAIKKQSTKILNFAKGEQL